jgi:hypothetical protein
MSDRLDPLIRDLVAWVAEEPRPYAEVLDAWRTSCPRLTVWEDASDRGLVERRPVAGGACSWSSPRPGAPSCARRRLAAARDRWAECHGKPGWRPAAHALLG